MYSTTKLTLNFQVFLLLQYSLFISKMEAVLSNHDKYFSRLVNMVPSDLYNHTESMNGSKVSAPSEPSSNSSKALPLVLAISNEDSNSKYFKHKKQPLAADEKKLLRQERKKRKYEPDQNEIEEDIHPSNNQQDMDEEDDKDNDEGEAVTHKVPFNKDAPSANLDELRKRLQERIAHMREQRQTKKPRVEDSIGKKAKNAVKKTDSASVSSSTVNSSILVDQGNEHGTEKKLFTSGDALIRAEALQQELLASHSASINLDDTSGLEFNPILQNEAELSEQIRQATKKREGGKVARLQRLLKEAEQKRQRLTTLMASGDESQQAKARAEQWNDVLTVAAGGKALLVSTIGHNAAQASTLAEQRIKKALKKREKKKEKSAKEWTERLRAVEDDKNAKLDKREENLKSKKQRHLGKAKEEADAPKRRGDYRGGDGADHSRKSGNTSNSQSKSSSSAGGHRAGFEGKKSTGTFLNKK